MQEMVSDRWVTESNMRDDDDGLVRVWCVFYAYVIQQSSMDVRMLRRKCTNVMGVYC